MMEHTLLGRAYAELDEWMEHENRKGVFNMVGVMWGRHPSWGSDPESDEYVNNRWAWHQNLGELLDFHGTAHIRNQNLAGVAKKRLMVTLHHPDQSRLEAVKEVTGGSIESERYAAGVSRLRIQDRGAFQVIKCGRLFVNPANLPLFEVLNVATKFYAWIPEPGEPSTDTQLANQDEEERHLITLLDYYLSRGPRPHNCQETTRTAAGGPLTKNTGFFSAVR